MLALMGDVGPVRSRSRALRMLLLLFLVLVLLGAGAGGFYVWATGASGPRDRVVVEIPEGITASEVGDILVDRDVIRSAFVFRVMSKLRDFGATLQAGQYELTTNMPLPEALDVLEAGPLPEPVQDVTIPEGFRVTQIAERVARDLGVSRSEFLRLAESGTYVLDPYLPDGIRTVEGFLFPKTYQFPLEIGAEAVLERLLDQFEREVDALPWERVRSLGVSPYEAVIIASMIEREARVPEDRRKIAAVIYNRLEAGMLLQIDATVLYALPEHTNPTLEDLAFDSPYNTYLYPGLPPTPIASPGFVSLEAALRPVDADYLFYVLIDCDGTHGFSETIEEHNALKARAPDCD